MDATWRGPSHRSSGGSSTLVQYDQRTKNSHTARGGHLALGTLPKGHLQHPRGLCCQGQSQSPPARKVWSKIWSLKHWPKINIFLWLVAHGSILTWDNLTKRGFIGLTICPLCLEEAETMNHLLNICPFSTQVWDHCASIMRTSDRKRDNISTTIEEWREVVFDSPILNCIWQLLPGFILWKIWKERNRRIFRNTQHNWQHSWTQVCHNIMEIVSLQHWTETDLICPIQEQSILKNWKFITNHNQAPNSSQIISGPLLPEIPLAGTTPRSGPPLQGTLSS